MKRIFVVLLFSFAFSFSYAQKPRARDFGIPLYGKPGKLNAITDVKGVEVGHTTLISGEGELIVGEGPVRTGVTAIFPRGKQYDPVFAGWYSLNGNGEMTGTTWVEESGFLEGPIAITNTHSVGIVRDAVVEWEFENNHFDPLPDEPDVFWALPVVAETYDGDLNDINGFHVKKEHVFSALDNAKSGPVDEGNVGGGTGMICHQFKGGIGTSSREVVLNNTTYTLGVLVQANYGTRESLTIAGVPVGKEISDRQILLNPLKRQEERGSIIVIVATNAPLLPHQLKRLARRVPIGISRVGGYGGNGSGDIFIAFSTANSGAANRLDTQQLTMIPNDKISSLFEAVAQATEESILNALVAAETMVGKNNTTVYELPEDEVIELLKKYGRINP
ncbi:P1 family peptidase [uncultured Algoriphagus sp.]|uniref:DmpA family aminopeptidase n=1 Tax=uncultured Algoriphagus sp. TaxID=417365 RepID=UPI00258A5577|nr:P1 family peptidase [uncultured Algoriphagus sp.]